MLVPLERIERRRALAHSIELCQHGVEAAPHLQLVERRLGGGGQDLLDRHLNRLGLSFAFAGRPTLDWSLVRLMPGPSGFVFTSAGFDDAVLDDVAIPEGQRFIAGIGADGTFEHVVVADDSPSDAGQIIAGAVDDTGAVHFVGALLGAFEIDGFSASAVHSDACMGVDGASSSYCPDGFHLSFVPEGSVADLRVFGSASRTILSYVTTDALGGVFVGGEFTGELQVNGTLLEADGISDVFIAKLTP